MKTKLFLLIISLTSLTAFAQTTSVPDDNFEAFLEANGMGDGVPNNDLVTTANISSVTDLIISLQSISDLTGIEDFTALQTLNCWGNPLGTLDVSNNLNLISLKCDFCSLTSLTLPSTSSLTTIECNDNNLTSLNLTNNPNLATLFCYDNPSLGSLNVASNPLLTTLECRNNGLTELDVTNNPALLALRCQNNSISTIDVSNNTLLLELGVTFNNLTELDVSTTTQLGQLYCHLNALTQLNLKNGHNDVLNSLNATNNSLTCIQVDNKTEAEGKGGWQKDPGTSYEETCPGLNLDEFDLSKILIYPNPSKDKFYIDLQSEANYTLSNVFGQEVKKGFLNSGKKELETNTLSNGLYMLNIVSPEGKVTKKLIKE